jgi:hypothetical protein
MCQICKDPIWSFICPHCLASDISKWLPASLRGAYKQFSSGLIRSFSKSIELDGLRCLHCRKIRLANICPFCYLGEVYDWLGERNPELASRFFRILPMRRSIQFKPSGLSWKDGVIPISATQDREVDEGMCETCEAHSDELVNNDGRWICRDCENIES